MENRPKSERPEQSYQIIAPLHWEHFEVDGQPAPCLIDQDAFADIADGISDLQDNDRESLFCNLILITDLIRRRMKAGRNPVAIREAAESCNKVAALIDRAAAAIGLLDGVACAEAKAAFGPILINLLTGNAARIIAQRLVDNPRAKLADLVPWGEIADEVVIRRPLIVPLDPDVGTETVERLLASLAAVLRARSDMLREDYRRRGGSLGHYWRGQALRYLVRIYEGVTGKRATGSEGGEFMRFCEAVFQAWGWSTLGLELAVRRILHLRSR